jgi:hypothetical protein
MLFAEGLNRKASDDLFELFGHFMKGLDFFSYSIDDGMLRRGK